MPKNAREAKDAPSKKPGGRSGRRPKKAKGRGTSRFDMSNNRHRSNNSVQQDQVQ